MKKLLFVFTLLFCCWSCEEEVGQNENQSSVDQNLFGTFQSETPFDVENSELFIIQNTTCGSDTIMSTSDEYGQSGIVTISFYYPNNFLISSSVPNEGNLSEGTFYTEGNKIYFNGWFKHLFVDVNGVHMGDYVVENIDFDCEYDFYPSQLKLSEFEITSSFDINLGLFGFDGCTYNSTSSSMESLINNVPLFLDNRIYNKVN